MPRPQTIGFRRRRLRGWEPVLAPRVPRVAAPGYTTASLRGRGLYVHWQHVRKYDGRRSWAGLPSTAILSDLSCDYELGTQSGSKLVNVQIVPSSIGDKTQQVLASYIVNDVVAIDAGALGLISPLEAQSRITHVFLSHSHLDHIASLPLFIDHVYKTRSSCVTIHASEATRQSLTTDIFNDRVWPNMMRLSKETTPFLKLQSLENERTVKVAGLAMTPVLLEHTVPTFGFLIEEPNAAIAIVSDTAPTQRIWDLANRTPDLKALFLEVSFPDSMRWLADTSRHLTSSLFVEEIRKIHQDVQIIAVHLKPAYRSEILRELDAAGVPGLEIGVPGETYVF